MGLLVSLLLLTAFVAVGCKTDDDEPTKESRTISYATTAISKTTADAVFTNELTNTGDGTVSYASSNTEVATWLSA